MLRCFCLFSSILSLIACGIEESTPVPTKDLVNFTLPLEVSEAAPKMQEQLYKVIHYNSSRFFVKPSMVFLDENTPTLGKLDTMVLRLNLLHLAYWDDEQLIWSGSLMHPVARGAHAFSKRGYEVSLRNRDGQMMFVFRDGNLALTHEFPIDTDHAAWLEAGKKRLYLNAYVFPEELVLGDREKQKAEEDEIMRRIRERNDEQQEQP